MSLGFFFGYKNAPHKLLPLRLQITAYYYRGSLLLIFCYCCGVMIIVDYYIIKSSTYIITSPRKWTPLGAAKRRSPSYAFRQHSLTHTCKVNITIVGVEGGNANCVTTKLSFFARQSAALPFDNFNANANL